MQVQSRGPLRGIFARQNTIILVHTPRDTFYTGWQDIFEAARIATAGKALDSKQRSLSRIQQATSIGSLRLPSKIGMSHIDAFHSRQPLVKGERLMRTERKTATVPKRPCPGMRVKENGHKFNRIPAKTRIHPTPHPAPLRPPHVLGLSPPKNCKNDLDDQT